MSGLKDRAKQEAQENLAIGENLKKLLEKAKKIGKSKDKAMTEDVEEGVAWASAAGSALDSRIRSALAKILGKEKKLVRSRPATDAEMKLEILEALKNEGSE